MEGLIFDEHIGDFHFYTDNGSRMLELWDEFCEDADEFPNEVDLLEGTSSRKWLVESGDRVVFKDTVNNYGGMSGRNDVTYSEIVEFKNSLNELITRKIKAGKQDVKGKTTKGWPEPVEAEGKLIFYNEYDHSVVVMVSFRDGAFQVTSRDFGEDVQ